MRIVAVLYVDFHLSDIEIKSATFSFSLQDLEGQEDFLVLKQFVDAASTANMDRNDRVRSLFQEDTGQKWFKGTVIEIGVVNPSYPDSLFNSVLVRYKF